MSLSVGTRIGPYEIVGPLGAGGMGEVYRARDAKLNRDVAIKVLLPVVANDPDRLARFSREAQVLASLNHPNIAHIYGIEDAAIVMELIEGEDLARRIAHGPVPLDEALPIARQIAEALEAAHDLGIIHRDLKPANIKVRLDGTVKVLDFGLAKAVDPTAGSSATAMNSPTLSIHATQAGIILGTAAYMSPEQARGKSVDKRTDIWALGAVLFEMLTGKRAFPGDDATDTIVAVVSKDPDWQALPPAVPAQIRRLLRRTLDKNSRQRLDSAAAVRLEIDDSIASPVALAASATAGVAVVSGRRLTLAWSLAALLAAAFAALATAMMLRPRTVVPAVFRSTILLTESLTERPPPNRFALSPDGRQLVYVGGDSNGLVSLWLRPLDGVAGNPLLGTEGANAPFWSPDGRFIAFNAGGKLKKIAVTGGTPVTLADVAAETDGRGAAGTWNRDDVIVFPSKDFSSLMRLPAAGGTPAVVTTINRQGNETDHSYPHFLPDGRRFLYVAFNGVNALGVYVGSIDGGPPVLLMEGISITRYANGSLLFVEGTTLMARPFDPSTLKFTAAATPLSEQLQMSTVTQRASAFSVSAEGVVMFQTGVTGGNARLAWSDREGRQTLVLNDVAPYRDVTLAADGKSAIVSLFDSERSSADNWIVDVVRGIRTRFSFDPADELAALWSPDGKDIVFNSRRKGHLDLYRRAAVGGGGEELLLADDREKSPTGWSPDGRHLLFTASSPDKANDVWVLPLFGERRPFPFAATAFVEGWAQFSPDGRWVAYASTESGRREIYVAPFPGPGGKKQVSVAGGIYPRWRGDGQELFYHSPDYRLMAAAIRTDAGRAEVTSVKALFPMKPPAGGLRNFFDVTRDGQRFLLSVSAEDGTATAITLLTNWPALVNQGK
jgi:Tol biopolymer transport system component